MDLLGSAVSSNSSSSSSSRSAGGEWTGKLYFYPDVHDSLKNICENVITIDELRVFGRQKTKEKRLEQLFGKDEEIELVRVYSNPLNSNQVTKVALHHAFVLFKTKESNTWWSVEKNTKSITIQTSKNGREIVRDCYRRERRPVGPTTPNTRDRDAQAKNNVRLYEFIQHLYDGKYLNDPYNLGNSNCQHFADRIFTFLAVPSSVKYRRIIIKSFSIIAVCALLFFYTSNQANQNMDGRPESEEL
jgi:hypothetical protein